jgi:hypothetical protein
MKSGKSRKTSDAPPIRDLIGAEKLRKQLHISGINMLNECGVRFQFRYILGMKRAPSAFLLAGTGTDKAVTADLDNKIAKDVLLPEDEVTDIARDAVVAEYENRGLELDPEDECQDADKIISATKDKAVRLVTQHHRKVAPELHPIRTARKFSINMDKFLRTRAKEQRAQAQELFDQGNKYAARILDQEARNLNSAAREGWDFAGEQDIVEKRMVGGLFESKTLVEQLVIRDTKTSAKSPNEDVAHTSEQLTGYALASHVIDGKLPDVVALDYLVDLKRETKNVTRESTRTMGDVGVFLNRFANAVNAIKSGIFIPTKPDDWRCSQKWCGYFNICPYAKRPKLVQITAEQGE